MTSNDVCNKLEILYKNKIKEKGLISSGKLYQSIKWSYENGTFRLLAEDYFQYLDDKYRITAEITSTKEFNDIIGEFYASEIEKGLTDKI